jgi:hypothetical protein
MAQEPTWAKDEEWTPSHTTEWLEERLAAMKRGGKQIDVLEGFDLSDTDIDALRGDFVQFLINNGDHDKIANAGSHSHWLNLQKRKQAPAWLLETSCPRLRNEEVPADFRLMAAGVVYDKVLNQIRVNKRQSESRESASTTPATSNTPTTRPSRSTASLNTGIRSNLGTENLHSSQAALNVTNATFVIHHGLTNNAIRSFPMISMLKPRHSDDLEDGTIQEKDLKPRMLSFKVLVKKMSSKLKDDFNPAKTMIWDPIHDTRITDDNDLQSAVLQQLEAKRLSAVYIQLREPEVPKRKRNGGGRVQAEGNRRRANGNAESSEENSCYNNSSSDDDGHVASRSRVTRSHKKRRRGVTTGPLQTGTDQSSKRQETSEDEQHDFEEIRMMKEE